MKHELPLWLFTLTGAYIITGLLLFLLAFLVYQFHLGEKVVDIAIIIVYILANFLAGIFIGKKKKVKRYLAGLGIGVGYFVLLVAVSLICNHGFQDFAGNFFTTLAICAGAGTIGGMLS
ncbi:MAG: TIGR04086 family membrane protein [Lachnospiraceae bacterium]|nr:TIGR04086 family membrane protein [Lachnospiraceae bacterium]